MNIRHNWNMVCSQTRSLKQMREAKGLTAREVAERLCERLGKTSMDTTTVYKHESNGVRDIDILRALSAIYDVPLDEVDLASKGS